MNEEMTLPIPIFSVLIEHRDHMKDLQTISFKYGWRWSTDNTRLCHLRSKFLIFKRICMTKEEGILPRRLRHSDNRDNDHIKTAAKRNRPILKSMSDWDEIIKQIELGYAPPNQLPLFSAGELDSLKIQEIPKVDLSKMVKDKSILYNHVQKKLGVIDKQ